MRAADDPGKAPLFRISLAEWSLHRELHAGKITNLDFPAVTRELGVEAVEYVNQFFKDKADDEAYLADLRKRCADAGVKSLLIMCDGEGKLGEPEEAKRKQAVENHHRWVRAAKVLGCHSIRVNAQSAGSYEEQQKLAVIQDLIDEQVRPYLQGDGGDLHVVGLEGNVLKVHYQGACGSCPSSISGTLAGIEGMVRRIDPDIEVVAV